MVEGSGVDPRVTVVMPTFNQAMFLRRAVDSLIAQTFQAWRLIIVDDGSTDETSSIVEPYGADPRIDIVHLTRNGGLGHALNMGLNQASGDFIAYLPSDDVYHAEHLAMLVAYLDRRPDAILAFSGVRHHSNRVSSGLIPGEPLQFVQALHRRTSDRWMERHELVTDDLDRMLWSRLQ